MTARPTWHQLLADLTADVTLHYGGPLGPVACGETRGVVAATRDHHAVTCGRCRRAWGGR